MCKITFALSVFRLPDINECDEGSHNCSQICQNTQGGFTCSCHDGFVHNSTTIECEAGNDTNHITVNFYVMHYVINILIIFILLISIYVLS